MGCVRGLGLSWHAVALAVLQIVLMLQVLLRMELMLCGVLLLMILMLRALLRTELMLWDGPLQVVVVVVVEVL